MADAEKATGHVLLLAGEAGIGKSRLVGVASDRAASRGWPVLEGHFFEPDRTLPFAGLIDMVRSYLTRFPTARTSLSPELARLLPDLYVPEPEAGTAPGSEPEQEKRRLFQAFA